VWSSGQVTLPADDESSPRPDTYQPEWWQPREVDVPVILPVVSPLVRTPTIAITLVGIHVHRNGAELLLERRMRRIAETESEWQNAARLFLGSRDRVVGSAAPGRLQYSVTEGNGEEVVADSPFHGSRSLHTEPRGASVMRTRPDVRTDQWFGTASEGLWLWPLPKADRLELGVRWPAVGIERSSIVIDSSHFAALAENATVLWEESSGAPSAP
jgi:hypothetical protein